MLGSKPHSLNVLTLAYIVVWFACALDSPVTYVLALNSRVLRWKVGVRPVLRVLVV